VADHGWTPIAGEFPWPPANGTSMSAFNGTDTDIRWDDPSTLSTGPATPSTYATTSITVEGTPDVLTAATAIITLVGAPIPAGDTISIDSVTLTAVVAAPGVDEFDGSSADTAVVAANIATAINDGSVGTWGIVGALAAGATITLTADTAGTTGNDTTLETASSMVALSGATLDGGLDAATLTIGGQILTASTSRTAGGMDFQVGPSSFDTAESIGDAISDTTNTLGFVTASVSGIIVTLSAFLDGILGNGIAIETDSAALTISSPLTSGGTGNTCPGKSNSNWTILGANIYRSDTGERGPYFRVNKIPVASTFYRDRTDIVRVYDEVVDSQHWIYSGDAPNLKTWQFRTHNIPVVKEEGNGVPADSTVDVTVTVDGQTAVVAAVFGPDGYITISTEPVWDVATESWVDPPTPNSDGSSVVAVSYYWKRGNTLVGDLDKKAKVFYRLTTVAIDPTGESPSGLVETPLGYAPPIAALNSEKLDYIWKEAIRRNRWILEQGGERVKLFIRRVTGIPCRCAWDSELEEYTKQPINNCLECYGTGFMGGYEGPIDLIVGPDDAERRVAQTVSGRKLEHTYEVWTGPSPMLSQRDFIVKQNGERCSIGPVRRTAVRGVILQQAFQIGHLAESDIRYKVPMGALERLPWPQTRYTRPEEVPCEEADPYPVGHDYQATPMGTDVAKIDDAREQRGRTPVWANITYGGKGP